MPQSFPSFSRLRAPVRLAAAGLMLALMAGPALAMSETRTALTASPSPSDYGQSVTLTATVTQGSFAVPVGGVMPPGKIGQGYYNTCVIRSNNVAVCWGYDGYGQSSGPTGVAATAVAVGHKHTCVLKLDTTVECFGLNDNDQTVVPSGLTATAISSRGHTTCAIRTTEMVVCWGADANTSMAVPANLGAVKAISVVSGSACAIKKSDSTVKCWGNPNAALAVPDGLGAVKAVETAYYYACAIKMNDMVECWAAAYVPSSYNGAQNVPAGLGAVAAISLSGRACALKSNGDMDCWGWDDPYYPIPADLGPVTAVVQSGHNCAHTLNGWARCWGANYHGATVPVLTGGDQGMVRFWDGATLLGTKAVVNGYATWTTSFLSDGPHSITAEYHGSGEYQPSTSPTINHDVIGPANGSGPPPVGSLTGGPGADTIFGTSADDTISGFGGNDALFGLEGNDTLIGGTGADLMVGGDGNDIYHVDDVGDVVFEQPGAGEDLVYASVSYTLPANVENLVLTGSGALFGIGNGGNNAILGNDGNNLLKGVGGDNHIAGGAGNDTIEGGPGTNTLDGGDGFDTLSFAGSTFAVTADLTQSVIQGDTIVFDQSTGRSSFENLLGSRYGDALTGDAGDNRIDGGLGADTMAGGAGNDVYDVDDAGDVVIETFGNGDDLVIASVSYTLPANVEDLILTGTTGFEPLFGIGNGENNVIVGNDGDNVLRGLAGDDHIHGGAGDDRIEGGAGNDTLSGGAGNDLIEGGPGADTLDGGDGIDTLSFAGSTSGITADLTLTVIDGDTIAMDQATGLSTFENLLGSRFADTLRGDAGNNRIDGGAGNDVINGRAGDDVIVGGLGRDRLTGGAGADVFVYAKLAESTVKAPDTITDFRPSQGDRIDLSAIDITPKIKRTNRFTSYRGRKKFTGKRGELRFFKGALLGDATGDGKANFKIILKGLKSLPASALKLN